MEEGTSWLLKKKIQGFNDGYFSQQSPQSKKNNLKTTWKKHSATCLTAAEQTQILQVIPRSFLWIQIQGSKYIHIYGKNPLTHMVIIKV